MIAVFTALSLAFSSIWVMGPEALADAIDADSHSYIHEYATHHPDIDSANHDDQTTQNQSCNHGCQVSVHLLGFVEINSLTGLGLILSQAVFLFSDYLPDNPFLQGPFRPPLAASLV